MRHLYPAFFLLAASALLPSLVRADALPRNDLGSHATLPVTPTLESSDRTGTSPFASLDDNADSILLASNGLGASIGPADARNLTRFDESTSIPPHTSRSTAIIPEPPTLLLLGSALIVLAFSGNRRTWAECGPLPNILPASPPPDLEATT